MILSVYKRCPLLVERKDAVELEADEYFIADMIGIEVVTEDDKPFGTLKRCYGDRCK